MKEEEKEFVRNQLYQDLEDEKYDNLIDFCIDNIFVKNNLEEYHLMLQYIILINRLNELEEQAKLVPFFISTATSCKKHPIYELISQSNQNLVKLANALQISRSNKVALEDYKRQTEDDNTYISSLEVLIGDLNGNIKVPDEVKHFIETGSDNQRNVSEIKDFCHKNNIDMNFLTKLKQIANHRNE